MERAIVSMDRPIYHPVSHLSLLVPRPEDTKANDAVSVYVRAELMHSHGDQTYRSKTVKGQPSPNSGHNTLDIIWGETLTWEMTPDDLAFIRFIVVEDKFAFDEPFAVCCARLVCVQEGEESTIERRRR